MLETSGLGHFKAKIMKYFIMGVNHHSDATAPLYSIGITPEV